jgi:hypothetical protein
MKAVRGNAKFLRHETATSPEMSKLLNSDAMLDRTAGARQVL